MDIMRLAQHISRNQSASQRCDVMHTAGRPTGLYGGCSLQMLWARQTLGTGGLPTAPSPGNHAPLVLRTAAPVSHSLCFSTLPFIDA